MAAGATGTPHPGWLLADGVDVAVITVTNLRPNRLDWLVDMHRSLHSNRCSFHHIIALDGAARDHVPAEVSTCPHTTIIGPDDVDSRDIGGVRNEALMRCRARWVTAVDDDDLLTAGSLDARLASSREHHHWICGHIADILDDGVGPRWVQPAPAGQYRPGQMLEVWPDPEQVFPYFGGALLMRTATAIAIGGWGTGRSDEDVFFHLGLTSLTPGLVIDDVVTLYRKHGDQRTQEPDYRQRLRARRFVVRERARLLVELFSSGVFD